MIDEFLGFVSIQLSKEAKDPLYVQLYHQVRELISSGKLSHGYLLPPVRKFARLLAINTGTVMSAYRLLEKNGYIFSRAGSGSYVAEMPSSAAGEEKPVENEQQADEIEFLSLQLDDQYMNLASIALNPDLVSVETFKKVLIEVLDRDQGYAFSYQESQGFYPLRESIVLNLKAHGVEAAPQNMQIISGAQQGIDIVAKAVLNYGDYVFMENPTYPGAIAAFRSRGAKIVTVPIEEDGIAIDELEAKLKKFRPKLIYVMPNIQNPTGYSYSITKRNRLMGLARYYNAIILEDDYISELSYGKEIMAPLKAIDRDGRVIYLKSFSKIFMPGLRLAFLTMPDHLAAKLLAVKHHSDISTSGLTQRAFDLYLRKGLWQAHINGIKTLYQETFQLTMEAMAKYIPSTVHFAKPRGGLSVWLALPEGMPARQIVEAVRRRGVLITEGTPFFPRPCAAGHYIRVSFAAAATVDIAQGIRIIGKEMESVL